MIKGFKLLGTLVTFVSLTSQLFGAPEELKFSNAECGTEGCGCFCDGLSLHVGHFNPLAGECVYHVYENSPQCDFEIDDLIQNSPNSHDTCEGLNLSQCGTNPSCFWESSYNGTSSWCISISP